MKKELRKGRVFPQCSANATDAIKTEEGSFDASEKDVVVISFATPADLASVSGQSHTRMLSKPGCTSVKKTVKRAEDLKNLKKETRAKWRRGGDPSRRANGASIKDDDEGSGYDSSMLASDDDESSSSDGADSSEEDATLTRLSKQRQNMDRRERLKRRRSGQPVPPRPHQNTCKRSKELRVRRLWVSTLICSAFVISGTPQG